MIKSFDLKINRADHLAKLLGHNLKELEHFADPTNTDFYYSFTRKKPDGSDRLITAPIDPLKEIQSRIRKRILDKIPLPETLHGSRKGRSPKTNAEAHVGKPTLVTLDIRKYFPSISSDRVYRLFKNLGCSPDVARLLTKLTTRFGNLPQGSPTSSAIANLVTKDWLEERFSSLCRKEGFTLTIYVDDIAISGPPRVKNFCPTFLKILKSSGFRYNQKKGVRVQSSHQPQFITGLGVNGKVQPNKLWRGNLRAEVHRFTLLKDKLPPSERESWLASIMGRISHLEQFNPTIAGCLRGQIQASRIRVRRNAQRGNTSTVARV